MSLLEGAETHSIRLANAPDAIPTPAVSTSRRSVLWALGELVKHGADGATDAEIVTRLAYTGKAPRRADVAGALHELRRLGAVENFGETRPSGSRIVWSLTDAGRDALA